jgi:hypothetical protein
MKTRSVLCFGTALFLFCTLNALYASDAPNWLKAGLSPTDYDMGTDTTVAHSGSSSGFIRSNKPEPSSFGTFMQAFNASEYRGKRLRYSAFVKCENIKVWAGLWLRVDKGKESTAFDNMQNRPIKGTQDWMEYSIVLDVDPMADNISFGILMDGPGAAWIDDIQFTVVGNDVPVTDITKSQQPPSGPQNLNFD